MLFQRACSEGLVTAVLNLTAIVTLEGISQWWHGKSREIGLQISHSRHGIGVGDM
jgi:hypothetical protein